jgi:hypothetical protein
MWEDRGKCSGGWARPPGMPARVQDESDETLECSYSSIFHIFLFIFRSQATFYFRRVDRNDSLVR